MSHLERLKEQMWLDVDKVLVCVLKYILHYKDVGNTIHSLLKTSQLNKVKVFAFVP